MSFGTILVHLADDQFHAVRLEVAFRLARVHRSHIVALFITQPVGMPAAVEGRGASAVYVAEAMRAAREKAGMLEQEFRAECKRHQVTWDWVVADGEHLSLLAKHAHVADLVIVTQAQPLYLEDWFRLRLPEELIMLSGCPVLMLPDRQEIADFGNHVMVAWKGTREAVRAVRDSLPFMRAAAQVSVVSLGDTPEDAISENEVVAFLRRHDIVATPHNLAQAGRDDGRLLLNTAHEFGADLLVMGASGRSRLKEMILGGITGYVFEHAELPIVASH